MRAGKCVAVIDVSNARGAASFPPLGAYCACATRWLREDQSQWDALLLVM
jgi:hypothetical protein